MTMSSAVMAWLEARALDVELADRMGLDSIRRDGGDALILPFRRQGEIVRRKYRFIDRTEEKWTADKGGQRIAFNEDCLRDETLYGQPVIITEGELDCIAAIQSGWPRSISVPDGAPPPGDRSKDDLEGGAKYSWLKEIRSLLTPETVPLVIIAADGDDNGAALLHDLSLLLGKFRCQFLTYPKARKDRGRERCKDLNEVLEDWGQKGVAETLNRAAWIRVDGVYDMSELPPLPAPRSFHIGFDLLGENYKMRLGDLVVVTGVPGLGKTTFVNDLCCRAAFTHGLRIAWASFEQTPQRDHRRNLRSWHGQMPVRDMDAAQIRDADDWIKAQHCFIVPSEDDDVTLDWLLDRAEVAVVQRGANVIVIDPWNEMDHIRDRDETATEYVGRAIKTFRRFARKMQVHVIVVAHPAKLQKVDGKYKPPTLYDISDSANWYNKCDLGLIVHRETADYTDIKVQKSRYHEEIGVPGEVRMMFGKDDRRFREAERLA